VALVALAAVVGQIALGGVVRVTGSGLGCPDWPLCHGRVVPPLEFHALIEYSHRMSASLLGMLVIAGTVLAWRVRRANPAALGPMVLALMLVMVAAALGGAAVVTELSWWVVLLHLGLAETVAGCLVVASVAGWKSAAPDNGGVVESNRLQLIMVVALLVTFALVLSGSYMVGLGYGSSCATWPLCRGSLLPGGEASFVHMAHRYVAGAAGALIAGLALAAWRRGASSSVRWAAAAALGMFLVQVALGAATVWTSFAAVLRSVHLVGATLVWVGLAYWAALIFPLRRFELRGLRGVSRLKRSAP
jgi:heme A synthase